MMDRIQREIIQRESGGQHEYVEGGDMSGYDMFRGTEDKAGRINWGQSVEDLIVRLRNLDFLQYVVSIKYLQTRLCQDE